jgi:hypothetical protein
MDAHKSAGGAHTTIILSFLDDEVLALGVGIWRHR